MRVIVVGATGRVGDAILRGLAAYQQITHVVSLTEENPTPPGLEGETPIEHRTVDLFDDLSDHFKFADAAVYVGWPISALPFGVRERQSEVLSNICQCIGLVGVRAFVYCSSASVYASAPERRTVDETWPILESTPFLPSSQLVRGDQEVGRFENHHPLIRVVRLRVGMVVCPTPGRPATLGKKILRWMTEPHRRLFVPDLGPYVLQCVHVDDFVDALCLALTQSVSGPFNVAADPITADLLAELFGARTFRVAPKHVQRVLRLGSRLPSGASNWAELALRRQVLDTTRAERDLHWNVKHVARSIVGDWIENGESVMDRVDTKVDANVTKPSVESMAMDLPSLYEQSLAYFGEMVHTIPDAAWGSSTGAGRTVWQLVASIALDQYRIALAAHGGDDAIIESQLPGDPLGVAPMDGWNLAAERGSLAIIRPDNPGREEENSFYDGLEDLLSRVIFELIRGGSELGRVIGSETMVPDELAQFAQRMEPPGSTKA